MRFYKSFININKTHMCGTISHTVCGIRNAFTTILDINYVDFLQFQQRYFTLQAELEEAFIYIIHKPIDFSIDFSCRLKT